MTQFTLSGPRCFELDGFTLDMQERRLLRAGRPVHLTQKPFQLLLYLVEQRERLVTRRELLERFWGERGVYDESLTRCVSFIRKALDDQQEPPRFIETRRAEGYRYIGPYRSGERAEASPLPPASPTPAPTTEPASSTEPAPAPAFPVPPLKGRRRWPRTAVLALLGLLAILCGVWQNQRLEVPSAPVAGSLAVLPLQNLSGNAEDAYFGDGLTESFITALSAVPGLKVIAFGSAERVRDLGPQEAGRKLKVETVLAGSLRQAQGQLRVALRLVNVADGEVLWARELEQPASDDLFALQDQVARSLARELRLGYPLRSGADSKDAEARRLYLKARYAWNRRTEAALSQAIRLFQEALARDPSYAMAYAGLADTYILLPFYGGTPPREAFPRAREAAQRALALDAGLAQPHATLAVVKQVYEWDWAGAEAGFRRALELNPSDATARQWLAEHLSYRGRFDEAVAEIERAYEFDPLSPVIATLRGSPYLWKRDYAGALARYREALELEPEFSLARYASALCLQGLGRLDQAIAAHRQVLPELGTHIVAASLAWTYAKAGRRDEARALLAELLALSQSRYVSPVKIASIHAGLGEADQALAWLERAAAEHDDRLAQLAVDFQFDSLRGDPRFATLLRRIGLAPTGVAVKEPVAPD